MVDAGHSSGVNLTASRPRHFVEVSGVSKTFADGENSTEALRDISFSFPRNRFVSLVGHSGCGKSTLLRVIAGLEQPTGGSLALDGMTPDEFSQDRPFGFVFQDAGLLPWKTTLENIRLPLDVMRFETPLVREERAMSYLRLARLDGFENSYPSQLSGGMRQRASIARSLCYRPEVLLMDEPFGALDDFTRREMSDELLRIYAEQQCSVFFVTHSLPEAVLLSDHIVVLKPRPGRVEAIIDIDLPRPRSANVRSSSEFRRYLDQLEEMIFGDGHA
jgi:NitT/TauT family transport system ATP-binding protein